MPLLRVPAGIDVTINGTYAGRLFNWSLSQEDMATCLFIALIPPIDNSPHCPRPTYTSGEEHTIWFSYLPAGQNLMRIHGHVLTCDVNSLGLWTYLEYAVTDPESIDVLTMVADWMPALPESTR